MGILNVTPDSFSDGGLSLDPVRAVERGLEIEKNGADILDIGGQSTRPGSEIITEIEEIERVIPTIEKLAPLLKIPISIDTYRAAVARRAIDAGAQVINDVSGLRLDSKMHTLALETGTAVVLMHSRGKRQALHDQQPAEKPEVICSELSETIEKAVVNGLDPKSVIADPGFGFSKNRSTNLKMLKQLDVFSTLGYPILVGVSRKPFINLAIPDHEVASWSTAPLVALAVGNGAHAIRVHDVAEMQIVAKTLDAIETAVTRKD